MGNRRHRPPALYSRRRVRVRRRCCTPAAGPNPTAWRRGPITGGLGGDVGLLTYGSAGDPGPAYLSTAPSQARTAAPRGLVVSGRGRRKAGAGGPG